MDVENITSIDIFISYDGEDSERLSVPEIAEGLKKKAPHLKIHYFEDPELTGDFYDFMEENLEKSLIFIPVCTEAYSKSELCKTERSTALKGKLIIPLYEKDVKIIPRLIGSKIGIKIGNKTVDEIVDAILTKINSFLRSRQGTLKVPEQPAETHIAKPAAISAVVSAAISAVKQVAKPAYPAPKKPAPPSKKERKGIMMRYDIPEDLKYTEKHIWAKEDGDNIRIGITDFAKKSLKEIVFVEFIAKVGDTVQAGSSEPIATIESTKAVGEIFAPVSGEVVEANSLLEDDPEANLSDPYGNSWIYLINPSNKDEDLENLLNAEQYAEHISQE